MASGTPAAQLTWSVVANDSAEQDAPSMFARYVLALVVLPVTVAFDIIIFPIGALYVMVTTAGD